MVRKWEELVDDLLEEEPLATIVRYLMRGEFVPSPTESVKPDEKFIGVLTNAEKAIYSARHKFAELANQMARQDTTDGYLLIAYGKMYNALDELLWIAIRNRFLAKRAVKFGLREGYKIVVLSPLDRGESHISNTGLCPIVPDPEESEC